MSNHRAKALFVFAPAHLLRHCQPKRRVTTCTQTPLDSPGLAVERVVLPRLRELAATTRRGREAGMNERLEVESCVRQLEDVSQPPPLLSPRNSLLDGVWHLIFLISSSARRNSDLQSRTIRASDDDTSAQYVTQTIDVAALRAENTASFSILGFLPIQVRVDANVSPLPDNETLEVLFQNAYFKVGPLPTISLPIRFFGSRGTLRTTYLTQNCRIGRGDKGSLFVLVRNP